MLWELYKTQNPDFDPLGDPNVNGPGSNADGGMATDELLDYLHKNGGPDGGRVVAYGTIDPTNIQAVERAIALFGFVWVDILVQAGNMEEFNQGKSWTNTGETPEGGHAVLGGGYDPRRKFETWTQEATFSDSFWTGRVGGDPLVSRVYVVIFEEHATKQFINSVSGQTLAEDYTALTGKSIVWPGQPTPSPSGDPDSVLAAAAKEFLQHHPRAMHGVRREKRVFATVTRDAQFWQAQHAHPRTPGVVNCSPDPRLIARPIQRNLVQNRRSDFDEFHNGYLSSKEISEKKTPHKLANFPR